MDADGLWLNNFVGLFEEFDYMKDAQLTIGGAIILIIVIIIIIAMLWFVTLPPSCKESEEVELVGVLYGFERNSSRWDVKLGNATYQFNHWDKSYMERLIAFNITISCCDRGKHYDFLTAYINEGD